MSDIIDIWGRKLVPKEETEEVDPEIAATMERNKKNKERVERERLAANIDVLNSYRIRRKK